MRISVFVVSMVLIACGAGSSTTAPVPKPAPTAATKPAGPAIDTAHLARELDAFVASIGQSWGEARAFSGYVHVAQADARTSKVLYSRAFGFADRAARRKADADTNFRIGSVTKQFTAAAVLLLAAEGKLALSDPIEKHIPEYPAIGAGVTIHQLLSHTSGIPSYTDDRAFMESRGTDRTPTELLAVFWKKPLRFSPGTKWEYSNSGYAVLGVIIERASDMPYARFMKERVFGPAGLSRTVVGDAGSMGNRAEGYELEGGKIAPAKKISMSVPYAAGAIRSTASDLVKWHQVLLGDGLLRAAWKTKLYTPVKKNYAYGWMVHEVDEHRLIQHGGGIDGFLTSYQRVMDANLVIVVWSNLGAVGPGIIAKAAREAAFGKKLEPWKGPKLKEADPALLARCAGSYALTTDSKAALQKLAPAVVNDVATIKVTVQQKALVVKPAGQPGFEVRMASDGRFHAAIGGIKFHCKPGSDSAPAATVTIEQGPVKIDYARAAK